MKKSKILELINNIFNKKEYKKLKPFFYGVTGSHIYGFSDESSDIDIRGFHIAPTKDFLRLTSPKMEIKVNQGNTTEGYEEWKNIDFRSYELLKFGRLLKRNFNAREVILCGQEVLNKRPRQIKDLCDIINQYLKLNSIFTYKSMAYDNKRKFLNPNRESYEPTPKKFLYPIRGLLSATYIQKFNTLETNVSVLSRELDIGIDVVRDLIESKVRNPKKKVTNELEERANDLIFKLFDIVEQDKYTDDKPFTQKLNNWMLRVRGKI